MLKPKDMKWAIETSKKSFLYSIISDSVAKIGKVESKLLKEQVEEFRTNMIVLVNLISSNGVPPQDLSGYLAILIQRILLDKESNLRSIKIPEIEKRTDEIINSLHYARKRILERQCVKCRTHLL